MRRSEWLLLLGVVLILAAFAASFASLPMRESDKTKAAKTLVAWIVQGKRIHGFEEAYPDAELMQSRRRRFLVTCDFAPSEVRLSPVARVRRLERIEARQYYTDHGYDGTVYVHLIRNAESERSMDVRLLIQSGLLGGHEYTFRFRRTMWGLRANGLLRSVS